MWQPTQPPTRPLGNGCIYNLLHPLGVRASRPLLQRNLLYTAITRGRKLVCVVGSSKAVGIAIRNNEVRERRTTLRDRLAGNLPAA